MLTSLAICIIGFIVSFMDGFGMGANDVSHSFGSSVGSGSLTMLQACTIALFTEFLGAALLGNHNAQTISGLVIANEFKESPTLLMLIMTCSLLGSSIWTISSAKIGLPVSSTHSISGAIIGSVLINYGFSHVNWSLSTGVAKIALSWVTSPIIAGLFAAFLYLLTRRLVLIHPNSYQLGKQVIPYYFAVTIFIELTLIISKTHISHSLNTIEVLLISSLSAGVSFLFFKYFLVPFIVRKIDDNENLKWYHCFYIIWVPQQPTLLDTRDLNENHLKPIFSLSGMDDDFEMQELNSTKLLKSPHSEPLEPLEQIEQTNSHLQDLHFHAEKFDPTTERLFGYVQVLTAVFASFSHGAKYCKFM